MEEEVQCLYWLCTYVAKGTLPLMTGTMTCMWYWGWLSPGGRSSGGRALTAKGRGPGSINICDEQKAFEVVLCLRLLLGTYISNACIIFLPIIQWPHTCTCTRMHTEPQLPGLWTFLRPRYYQSTGHTLANTRPRWLHCGIQYKHYE